MWAFYVQAEKSLSAIQVCNFEAASKEYIGQLWKATADTE